MQKVCRSFSGQNQSILVSKTSRWLLFRVMSKLKGTIRDCVHEQKHWERSESSQKFQQTMPSSSTVHTHLSSVRLAAPAPHWGAADAEIKVPSGENTELRRSPFKAWIKSIYSHACYTKCQGFLPCLFLPFWSIHLHFFQNLSQFCVCWLWLTHGSCVGPQNKIGHPPWGRFPWWVPAENK